MTQLPKQTFFLLPLFTALLALTPPVLRGQLPLPNG